MVRKQFSVYLFILLPFFIEAQEPGLELIHAQRTIGQMKGDERVRYFEGDVHFRQDTLDMYCDKASFYENQNRADFEGQVRIYDGTRKVYSDKIEYYPQTRQAVCTGKVRISTADDSLAASYVTFNFNTEKAVADKDVYIFNKKNLVQIWGEKGNNDPELGQSVVEKSARLVRIDTSSSDTLRINADKLIYIRKDKISALALGNVRIQQGALLANCDTAIYYPDLDEAWLRQDPSAWYEKNKMWGKRIRIGFTDQKVKTIDIYGDAQTTSLVDSLKDQWNTLRGKQIHLDISDKKPQLLRAAGTASSTYFLQEEDKASGMNAATADTIYIFFKDSKADSIRISGGAQGVYYPEDYKGVKSGAR